MAETVIGLGTKRARRDDPIQTQSRGGGSAGDPTLAQTMLGTLPSTVGSGEHEKPILEADLQGMRDLSMDVQDLKGATYLSWELERDSEYVTLGMEYKEQY